MGPARPTPHQYPITPHPVQPPCDHIMRHRAAPSRCTYQLLPAPPPSAARRCCPRSAGPAGSPPHRPPPPTPPDRQTAAAPPAATWSGGRCNATRQRTAKTQCSVMLSVVLWAWRERVCAPGLPSQWAISGPSGERRGSPAGPPHLPWRWGRRRRWRRNSCFRLKGWSGNEPSSALRWPRRSS